MPTSNPKLSKDKEHEIISSFKFGYRNREDKTNLDPSVLVDGSQNVLTNVYGRISARKGYTLDGPANTASAPISSSYDWEMHIPYTTNDADVDTGNTIQHLRGGSLTSAGNDGKLQYRYVDSAGTVTWKDLITDLDSVNFNFCDYWDNSMLQSRLLMVNGESNIREWSGGIATLTTVLAAGITKAGSESWAELGFYPTGTHTVWLSGVAYAATGGWGTTTLTGVSPTPFATAHTVGAVIHQVPEKTLLSAMGGITTSFTVGLIANLRNQIYIAPESRNEVFVSKVNNYKNYSYTAPTRVVGEGMLLTLDGIPKALVSQEDRMYIAASLDQWYQTKFTLSDDLTKEALEVVRLKTTPQQGAKSQGLTSKIKNNVIFVSNEPILNSLGWVENIYGEPQTSDLSFPVVNDFNSFDFTDGQVIFHKNFIYVSVPKESRVMIYNMTNPNNKYWEAPQVLPIGRFSIIDGNLYGHSYLTSETYKLFDGYNDNGNFIQANAVMAFNSHGMRSQSKGFNEYYVEGYISSNTTLSLGLQYDIDGCATNTSFDIVGDDTQIVCIGSDNNLLGKKELGKVPLGADMAVASTTPVKFRVVKTMPKVPYYEYQVSFNSVGYDQNWEILAFGCAWSRTFEGNNKITQ
jgi:hypothetical protein